MCLLVCAAGRIQHLEKASSVYRERGNKNQSSSERLLRVLSWERRVGTGQEQGGPVQGEELVLIP